GAWTRGDAGQQLLAALGPLKDSLELIRLLSHARSKEGIAALAAAYDLAEAHLKNLRKAVEATKRDLDDLRVYAPAAGTVLQMRLIPGSSVVTGREASLLCIVSPTDTVRVAFTIEPQTREYYREMVREGKITIDKISDVEVLLALPGKKDFTRKGHLERVE